MLSFTIAHVSVVALRYREPDRPRPYRVPWNVRFRGGDLPLTAVLGGLGTFAAWVSVVALHTEARTVGVAWMVVGVIAYFVYRRRSGLDPRVECRIERKAAPEGFSELAYGSALVPMFGTDVNARALVRAANLAGDDAVVDALYVIQVPHQLPLDAELEEEEALAQKVLDVARIRARERKLKIRTGVVRTRNPGAALVDEARQRQSEVVYLDTIHGPPSEQALGPTATYLLTKRPCRIIVEMDGGGRKGHRSAAP
jgi:APA family basic amino acid/polyamine antiporter